MLLGNGMSRRFILTIDEDDHGDLFVTLPDELTEELGWLIGDTLQYQVDDETLVVTKLDE
jgi:bifunctional DNA-binding transcriptional regulator/antitoxin component of YhaV-PrlF toxin-antitoxin module|tara:strand:- start:704 stop:883 length:180 start_codon:yes stop_codon:yes gene_type:complete